MLSLNFWIEDGTRRVIFALAGWMWHHVSRCSHVHSGGNVAHSFCWSLQNIEMVPGFVGHLISLHLHHFLIVIVRFAMWSKMGGLCRSHWSNTLGTSGLQILIIYVNWPTLEVDILGIKHLLLVLVGRWSPEDVGRVLKFLISTKKREVLFLGVCIIRGVAKLGIWLHIVILIFQNWLQLHVTIGM